MTFEQAKDLVNELGFARLVEPRARDVRPIEPVPQMARKVHLPRKWRGHEMVLHEKLNVAAIPILQAELERATSLSARDELALMIRFAKKVKLAVKPADASIDTKADAA